MIRLTRETHTVSQNDRILRQWRGDRFSAITCTDKLHGCATLPKSPVLNPVRSEEHTSELQSLTNLVCRLLLEKKKTDQGATRTVRSIMQSFACRKNSPSEASELVKVVQRFAQTLMTDDIDKRLAIVDMMMSKL